MWNQELLNKHAGVSLMKERADSRDLKTLFNPKTLTWTFAVHSGLESGFTQNYLHISVSSNDLSLLNYQLCWIVFGVSCCIPTLTELRVALLVNSFAPNTQEKCSFLCSTTHCL